MTLPARRPPHPIGGVTRGWWRRGVPGYCPHLRSQNEGAPRGGRTPRGTRRCHVSLVPPQWHVAPEAPTITFRLTWFANILPVSRGSRPAVGASSACRSGQSKNLLSDLSEDRKRRAGAQARSTHAAKILTPAVGLYPLMGYRPTGGGMRVNPPSKREGPAEALYLCRCASTLRSPPAGGGLWEVSAGW